MGYPNSRPHPLQKAVPRVAGSPQVGQKKRSATGCTSGAGTGRAGVRRLAFACPSMTSQTSGAMEIPFCPMPAKLLASDQRKPEPLVFCPQFWQ